jgi:hypothetical protein
MITEREVLVDQVIEQIRRDIDGGDYTAIYEMLMELKTETLIAYLPEEKQ